MRVAASQRRIGAAAACAGIAVVFFFAGLVFALQHDFHRKMQSPTHNILVAAAISEVVYDLDQGYIAYGKVLETLRGKGMADQVYEERYLQPLGLRYPQNLSNTDMMNAALESAAALQDLPPDPKVGDESAVPAESRLLVHC